MYPSLVMTTNTSLFSISISSESSPGLDFITLVLRSSPNAAFISSNSFFTTARTLNISWMRDSSFLISSRSIFSSSSILLLSRPTSRRSCISSIALAWISERPNFLISFALASGSSLDLRIVSTTSSILSSAMIYPSSICARALASFSSYSLLLVTISTRCFT